MEAGLCARQNDRFSISCIYTPPSAVTTIVYFQGPAPRGDSTSPSLWPPSRCFAASPQSWIHSRAPSGPRPAGTALAFSILAPRGLRGGAGPLRAPGPASGSLEKNAVAGSSEDRAPGTGLRDPGARGQAESGREPSRASSPLPPPPTARRALPGRPPRPGPAPARATRTGSPGAGAAAEPGERAEPVSGRGRAERLRRTARARQGDRARG